MKSNSRAKRAYRRGYEAGQQGKTLDDNPYNMMTRSKGGVGLGAWWSTGLSDQCQGRRHRFGGGDHE